MHFYRYLGVEHGEKRLLWSEYLERIRGKVDGVLSDLRRLSFFTNVLSRTLLWKVFGRSTMEYALSLALAIRGRPSAVLMNGPENVQNRALAWIFNGMSSYRVTHLMVGLASMAWRVEEPACLAGWKAERLADSNRPQFEYPPWVHRFR